jgi:hypothetical protein
MKMSDGSRTLPAWSGSSFSVNFAEGGNICPTWPDIVDGPGVCNRSVELRTRSTQHNTKSCQAETKNEDFYTMPRLTSAPFCVAQSGSSVGLLKEMCSRFQGSGKYSSKLGLTESKAGSRKWAYVLQAPAFQLSWVAILASVRNVTGDSPRHYSIPQ